MEIHIKKFTSHPAPKQEEVLPTLQVIFCFKCCNNFDFLHVTLNGCVEVPDMIKVVFKKNNCKYTLQNTREIVVLI